MFIRATRTGTASDGSPRLTHRLVENQRRDGKVRQTTLLNLGRHFSIDRDAWPLLCERIEELLSGQSALGLEPLAPQLEAEARRITARLVQRQGVQSTAADWETVDVASVCDSDGRSVGVEHAALAALDMLGLPGLFDELGFNRRQRCCALANIIARMAHPGSERATNRWLRAVSATGELLGLDFGSVSDMALYRASDLLLSHQKRIEEHVFGTAQTLFDLAPTITLYDLTNTFYEGQAAGQPKAQRGHSKEGRTDAPLLTLGLVLDASGFVRRSSVFPGNVTEATTLGTMLESLGASREGVVIMDRGIATKANLVWLRDNGYRYLVVSRDNTRVFDADKATTTVLTASRETVDVYIEEVVCEAQDARNYQEVLLRCHSEARAKKEKGILDRFQKRFEDALAALHEGLSKPRTRKGLDSVARRIGRLQKANARVAQHYEITVTPDDEGNKAVAVSWTLKPVEGTMMSHPGVYCLRSNILDWDGETLWRTYMTLTDVEAVFRSLKSELGLRPIFHHKPHRADGHLFISVLAYQAVQVLRTRLKRAGCHDNWTTLRNALRPLQRTTTTFTRNDGRTLHLRKTALPDDQQAVIYHAMGVTPPPRNVRKTVV